MNKLGVLLLSGSALMLPTIASAQRATLEICNNGRLDVVVAVAARIQTFITGYKWSTRGWFTATAGQCTTVYDEDYDAAGPYTPQSGARVSFAVTRSDGVWGAYQSSRVQSGWMRSGTGQICVNRNDAFAFSEATADPTANCKGVLVPTAHDFMPDGPGKFTYTIDWDGYESFVPLGERGQPKSSVANSRTSDSVDNSLSAQFLRALAQEAKKASDSAASSRASSGRAASSLDRDASSANGRADLLNWVREDVNDYIEASKTGFQAYKTGDVQLSQGYRMWNSSVKPALADNCWVVQGTVSTTFSCMIPEPDTVAARAYYSQVADDVTASLPADWSPGADAPFGGDLPGKGYRSTSEAHGEVWLARAAAGSGYELHFQLVSAPSGSQPAKSAEDDPIGGGGVITRPTPPAPPAPPRRKKRS